MDGGEGSTVGVEWVEKGAHTSVFHGDSFSLASQTLFLTASLGTGGDTQPGLGPLEMWAREGTLDLGGHGSSLLLGRTWAWLSPSMPQQQEDLD